MEDKYKLLSAQELACEDDFIRWVLADEHHQQWTQWLQINPERISTIEEAKNIVKAMSTIPLASIGDEAKTELWDRIRSDISSEQQKKAVKKQSYILRWTLIAAAALALLIWLRTDHEVRNVIVDSGERDEIELPETSIVTLNAGSRISYNKAKFKVDREIRMEGEAFFKVSPGSRFTVITPQGIVTVMGTSFNVISRPGRFEVSCYTGKVKVEQSQFDKVEITSGQKCYTEKSKEKLKMKTFDPSSASPEWTQGKFTFDDQPLSVVVSELERQYNVKVKLGEGIGDIRYTGLFESGDLTEALHLITWPLHLTTQDSGKTISISR